MENTDLAEAIDNFCRHVAPLLIQHDTRLSEQEFLTSLEEFDSQFDNLSIVKIIKARLSELVASELRRSRKKRTENETEASKRVERILQSEKFKKCRADLLLECKLAVQMLNTAEGVPKSGKKSSKSSSAGAARNVGDSWFGQSTFLFMGPDFLKRAVGLLQDKNTYASSKIEILKQMMAIPSAELANSAQWPAFCKCLVSMALDGRTSSDAVTFLAKMFNAVNPSTVTRAFANVSTELQVWCDSYAMDLGAGDQLTLDLNESVNVRTYLALFRLWHRVLVALPNAWLRYPETTVVDLVRCCIEFLSGCVNLETSWANPLLPLALLSPKVIWMRAWFQGFYSREKLIAALKLNPGYFEQCLQGAVETVGGVPNTIYRSPRAHKKVIFTDSGPDSSSSVYSAVQNAQFLKLYCLRAAVHFLSYPNCLAELFPVHIKGKSLSADQYLSRLIKDNVKCEDDTVVDLANYLLVRLATKSTGPTLFLSAGVAGTAVSLLRNKYIHSKVKAAILDSYSAILNVHGCADVFNQLFIKTGSASENQRNLSEHLTDFCADLVESAAERDANVKAEAVQAAVFLCSAMAQWAGPRMVIPTTNFVSALGRLVQDKRVDVDLLLPFLAMFDLPDVALKRYRRSLFASACMADLRAPLDIGPTVLDCFIAQLEKRIKAFSRSSLISVTDSKMDFMENKLLQQGQSFIRNVPPLVFTITAHPGAAVACVADSRFLQLIMDPLQSFGNSDASVVANTFALLNFVVTNLDFAVELQRVLELSGKIIEVLRANCTTKVVNVEQGGGDSVSAGEEMLVMSRSSVALVDLFLHLTVIGGPKERTFKSQSRSERFPSSLRILEQDLGSYFQAEPSRFLIKRITVAIDDLPKGEEKLLEFFYECLATRQRIPYPEILLRFIRTVIRSCSAVSAATQSEESKECRKDQQWALVLEYGKSLKIIQDKAAALMELKAAQTKLKIYDLLSPVSGTDWFGSAVFLLMDGDTQSYVEFLLQFSLLANSQTLWSFLCGPEYFAGKISCRILPVAEKLVESQLPNVKAALALSGVSLYSILSLWLNQCFLSILEWPEVCNYLTLSVLGGQRYQVYFCVTLLKHLQDEICRWAQVGDFPWCVVTGGQSHSFKLHPYLPYLKHLSELTTQ